MLVFFSKEPSPTDGDGSDPETDGSKDSSAVTTSGLAIIGGLGGVFVVLILVLV